MKPVSETALIVSIGAWTNLFCCVFCNIRKRLPCYIANESSYQHYQYMTDVITHMAFSLQHWNYHINMNLRHSHSMLWDWRIIKTRLLGGLPRRTRRSPKYRFLTILLFHKAACFIAGICIKGIALVGCVNTKAVWCVWYIQNRSTENIHMNKLGWCVDCATFTLLIHMENSCSWQGMTLILYMCSNTVESTVVWCWENTKLFVSVLAGWHGISCLA